MLRLKMSKRVADGLSPPAPTPSNMRVRTRQAPGKYYFAGGGSGPRFDRNRSAIASLKVELPE